MSQADKPSHNQVEAASFTNKARHRWVDAQTIDAQPHHRSTAGPYTPNEYHNQSGPDSEMTPDPALIPSLITLAATLGIPLLAGERLLDGESAAFNLSAQAIDDEDSGSLLDPGFFADD